LKRFISVLDTVFTYIKLLQEVIAASTVASCSRLIGKQGEIVLGIFMSKHVLTSIIIIKQLLAII